MELTYERRPATLEEATELRRRIAEAVGQIDNLYLLCMLTRMIEGL